MGTKKKVLTRQELLDEIGLLNDSLKKTKANWRATVKRLGVALKKVEDLTNKLRMADNAFDVLKQEKEIARSQCLQLREIVKAREADIEAMKNRIEIFRGECLKKQTELEAMKKAKDELIRAARATYTAGSGNKLQRMVLWSRMMTGMILELAEENHETSEAGGS